MSLSVVIPTLESGRRAAIEGVEALVVGGALRFALDTACPARFYSEWAVRLRARILGLAFGDQAIFCVPPTSVRAASPRSR